MEESERVRSRYNKKRSPVFDKFIFKVTRGEGVTAVVTSSLTKLEVSVLSYVLNAPDKYFGITQP